MPVGLVLSRNQTSVSRFLLFAEKRLLNSQQRADPSDWIYAGLDPKGTVTTASSATAECDTILGQAGGKSGKSRFAHLTWQETNVVLGQK